MWLSFKTAFPKYLSDWQMEMSYSGAGGEWIRNKTEEAGVSTTSIEGRMGLGIPPWGFGFRPAKSSIGKVLASQIR